MKNIKVLHLSSEKAWRGGEQQIAYLIEALSKLGVVNYVAARKNSPFEDYCRGKDIEVFPLSFKNSIDVDTALSIKSICRSKGIHIVHMHSAKSHGIGVLSALFGNNIPLVLSRRVMFAPKQTWLTRWKYNHQSIKRILCVSDKVREVMQAYINQPEKCSTVYAGVDLAKLNTTNKTSSFRTEYVIPQGIQLIGNTSALESEKDYITFINTIDILIQKEVPVHAVIIGKGSLEQSLKSYVFEKGLMSSISFTGFRKDIMEILPELDIFLMPSREEGLGTSILDAFLAKVPVVATIAGGIPEMVIHEQTGMLATIGDAHELATHIERIITNKELRNTLVEGALNKVKEFSKETTAMKTLTAYQQVLTNSKPIDIHA